MQAIANTGVQEGFSIIRTPDQRGSVEHLALFTRILQDKYQGLTLTSCSQVSYTYYIRYSVPDPAKNEKADK